MTNLTTQTIRLLLVDDHVMFREGLTRMFEREQDLKIVSQCASATEALALLRGAEVDVVLLDVDLGPERALDFVTAAKQAGFPGRTLIVTAGISEQEAVRLIQCGVAGILHKQNSTAVLCQAIRQVAAGEVCLEKAYRFLVPVGGPVAWISPREAYRARPGSIAIHIAGSQQSRNRGENGALGKRCQGLSAPGVWQAQCQDSRAGCQSRPRTV